MNALIFERDITYKIILEDYLTKFEVKCMFTEDLTMDLSGLYFDIILMDYQHTTIDNLQFLDLVNDRFNYSVPILIITENDDRNLAIESLKHGAQDYLIKGQFNPYWLNRSIFYSIERFKFKLELEEKNEKLNQLARTDELTGIFNIRFIKETLEFEFKRAKRYGHIFSCIMFDIDDFKFVNDNLGHLFGDYVLHRVCAIVSENLRECDVFGRYGGDEFIIVLPSTDKDKCLVIANKILEKISKFTFVYSNRSTKITVSAGVCSYSEKFFDHMKMFEETDKRLYEAKHNGKNMIC